MTKIICEATTCRYNSFEEFWNEYSEEPKENICMADDVNLQVSIDNEVVCMSYEEDNTKDILNECGVVQCQTSTK